MDQFYVWFGKKVVYSLPMSIVQGAFTALFIYLMGGRSESLNDENVVWTVMWLMIGFYAILEGMKEEYPVRRYVTLVMSALLAAFFTILTFIVVLALTGG